MKNCINKRKINKNKNINKFQTRYIYYIPSFRFSDKLLIIVFLIIFSIIIANNLISLKVEEILYKESFNNETFTINFKNDNEMETIFLNISYYMNSYSLKHNIVEIIYSIKIFDKYKNLIKPFDLAFYYNLHLFCNFKTKNDFLEVESFPNTNNNTNFICTEYFNFGEIVKLGIKIYQKAYYYKLIFQYHLFKNISENYLDLYYKNDSKFSSFMIDKEYNDLINEIKENKSKYTLKSSYIEKPTTHLKTSKEIEENNWIFKNIYNQYFCFCKGINCEKGNKINIFQRCKYFYYLTIIDKNRNLYEKTEYLLADFITSSFNSDDIFPIFREMINQNISAHYMTTIKEIYNQYCSDKRCWRILTEEYIDGDFLEKYLNLILRLKATIAGADFPSINYLFYNIEYIVSINIGHGVKYFKSFLYKNYTSPNKYNKLVLAPSKKIISVAKEYGWKEENIIKICLPKWDKYYNRTINKTQLSKSIFIFFTFREGKEGKNSNKIRVSQYYTNNILNLLSNSRLKDLLNKNNITLIFGLHPNLFELASHIRKNYNFVKIIETNMISKYLLESNLLITDFSSVTFDFIYQRKPVIIYIPDYEDPNIKDIYSENYYNLIKNLGNGTIYFENQFHNINDLVDKILFYIKSNFKLEREIEKFYDSFELNCKNNNINNFIDYLRKIK